MRFNKIRLDCLVMFSSPLEQVEWHDPVPLPRCVPQLMFEFLCVKEDRVSLPVDIAKKNRLPSIVFKH